MQYGLVHNNKIVVGPRSWSRGMFMEYFEDENIQAALPPREPNEPIYGEDWSILPVSTITTPELDQPFEQLVGPFWTINTDHITGYYTKTDTPLPIIKAALKSIVANNRYNVEVGKLEYTFQDGQVVDLYTEREERMIYLNTLLTLPDGMTVPFKFRNGVFRSQVTKADLQAIVGLGMMHIASAFEWENEKYIAIDNANSITELRSIELRHPSQIPVE